MNAVQARQRNRKNFTKWASVLFCFIREEIGPWNFLLQNQTVSYYFESDQIQIKSSISRQINSSQNRFCSFMPCWQRNIFRHGFEIASTHTIYWRAPRKRWACLPLVPRSATPASKKYPESISYTQKPDISLLSHCYDSVPYRGAYPFRPGIYVA